MTQGFKHYLAETSLSRLYEKTKGHSVGAITTFRGDRTYSVNHSNNQKLLAYLLDKGYSVTKIKGSYIEQHGTPSALEVGEESFFVANPEPGDDGGKLENDLIQLGKLFDQDSIMSYRYNDSATLIGTSDREDSFPGLDQRKVYPNETWGFSIGPFFSRVKGRQFSFGESIECKRPDTLNGIRVMSEWAKDIAAKLRNL